MPHDFQNALIVVAKRPSPGKTKTRLTPPLTPDMASQLYECFLLDTLAQMRQVKNTQMVIAYVDGRDYFEQIAPDFQKIQQEGEDLGARLDNALSAYLSRGYQRVVIMNSDSPTLPSRLLAQSFIALQDGADVVLGPCQDGGYYLIGIKKPAPRLLRDVKMSTPSVTADTMALAKEEGLKLFALPTWYDVDDWVSLSRLLEDITHIDPAQAVATRRFLQQENIRSLIRNGG